ncbi:MAG: peptidoglycan DD-metalloendopeptidase family protein [Chloroflexi bacterium]|jgi:hypothetical protein|nr:peptidoglycan DD-metalloendopeptidase family protein [Chloroflexota bacterium]
MNLLYPFTQLYPLTQGFGEHPDWYTRFGLAGHNGIDLAAPAGTPVLAAAAGVVSQAGSDPQGYGLYLVLDHGDGVATLYGHLSERLATSGQAVPAGQAIGRVGWSGNVIPAGPEGAHLHFELRIPARAAAGYGGAVDPLPYLAENGPAEPGQSTRDCRLYRVVSAGPLRIRSGPGTQYRITGSLNAGQSVRIEGIAHQETWLRLAGGGYAAMAYGADVYLVPVEE